jgi:hypothetical protein
MPISLLTFLAFYLNGAIDTGRYDDLGIDEIKREVREGTIFTFLRNRLGSDIDLSVLDAPKEEELLAEWQDMLAAVNERRKFGIEHRGLPLLVAYLLEGVQRRAS